MHLGPLNSTDAIEFNTLFVQQRPGDMHLIIPLSHRCIFKVPVREQRRPPASSSPRISDANLSSSDYPLQGSDLAGDLEQLEEPARPTNPDFPLQGTDLAGDLEQQKLGKQLR